MNVSLATQHGATYFNILAPGENEVAMFNGSVGQNQYEGALPSSGDYKIDTGGEFSWVVHAAP